MAAVLILLLALGALSAATPVPRFDAEVIAKRSAADDVASKVVGIEQSVLNSSHVACTASAIPYDMYYIRSSSTGKYFSFQTDWTISSDAASPYVWSIAAINNADNEGTVDGTTTVVASCQGVRRTIEAPGHNFCVSTKWDNAIQAEHWAVMYNCSQPPVAFSKTLWFFYPNSARACGSAFGNATDCLGTFEIIPTNHILDNATRAISSVDPTVKTTDEWITNGAVVNVWDQGNVAEDWEIWKAWA